VELEQQRRSYVDAIKAWQQEMSQKAIKTFVGFEVTILSPVR
jgi:hypothetical protein